MRDGSAALAIVSGLLFGVALAFPSEGRVTGPLSSVAGLILGQAAFLLPVLLLLVGAVILVAGLFPERPLPLSRLMGTLLLALAALPTFHLVGIDAGQSLARAQAHEGGGIVGHLLGTGLLDAVGGPGTAVLLAAGLVVGLLLMFDLGLLDTIRFWVRGCRFGGRGIVAVTRVGAPVARAGGVWAWRGATSLYRFARSRVQGRIGLPHVAWTRPAPPRLRPTRALPPSVGTAGLEPRPARSVELVLAVAPGSEPPEREAVAAPAEVETAPSKQHALSAPAWRLPTIELLQAAQQAVRDPLDSLARARLIEETLASFNIEAHVVEANEGPAVTQFGIEPAPGVAVNRILSRQNDLALRLGVSPIRLEAPVPGKRMVGLEVPNPSVAIVTVRDVVESPEWEHAQGKLRLALGRDVSGHALVGDLGRMPHLLIAGATGAGKSVCLNTIVCSLLYQYTPDELQLIMIDPKRVELSGFGDAPHLRLPVMTDMGMVVGALKWVVLEMERRYQLFSTHGVRNLESYNRWAADAGRPDEPTLPFLVVVIDELADMMMTAADEVEKTLCRLAQLARATGIHLVVATQRPSVDVLTGLIKANFPTRIAFAVSSQTDSRVILDQAGAEKLLGRGDALYLPTDAMKPARLQGAYISDEEIRALVTHWQEQGGARYTPDDLAKLEALARGDTEEDEELYDRAIELAEKVGRVSVSLLQRRLSVGQPKAQRLLDRLVEDGFVDD